MRYSFRRPSCRPGGIKEGLIYFESANAKEVHREHYARRSLRDAARVFHREAEVVDVFVINDRVLLWIFVLIADGIAERPQRRLRLPDRLLFIGSIFGVHNGKSELPAADPAHLS